MLPTITREDILQDCLNESLSVLPTDWIKMTLRGWKKLLPQRKTCPQPVINLETAASRLKPP